jgi:hypothetical protein
LIQQSQVKDGMVSTVIPVYNRAVFLREAVESVIRQTYRPIEVIIVDDGSTDDTPELIQALAVEYPETVRLVRKSNEGVGLARESGRQVARGEYIQYLDSDDRLLPQKFEIETAALVRRPECGAAYSITRLIDEQGNVLKEPFRWTANTYETLFPALLVDRWWSTHTPLFRRSVCEAAGPWRAMRMAEDWEYEARLGALGLRLVYCPLALSDTRHHQRDRLTGKEDSLLHCRDMVKLMQSLFCGAMKAGVPLDSAEMQHFARWCFMEVRRAGAAGLGAESRACFDIARSAAGGRWRAELSAYRVGAALFGWTTVGKLAIHFERVLGKRSSSKSLPLSWTD